jgi:hypothetical protein
MLVEVCNHFQPGLVQDLVTVLEVPQTVSRGVCGKRESREGLA